MDNQDFNIIIQNKSIKDTEKDSKGRLIVDLVRPHILEDMQYFRQAAIHFEKYGVYTKHPYNEHPLSDYYKFWKEEERRCKHGLVRDDGEWISGYYYFYLNYSPIWLTVVTEENENGNNRGERFYKFPKLWDSDYLYFHYIEQAEQNGRYGAVLKTRGRGYSFKGGAMLARNYYHFPGSKSYAMAFEKEYLTKDGLLTKAWDVLDWVDTHTPWAKLRQKVDREMHKRASYIDPVTGVEKGTKSEIIGVSLKDNPDKARGKRGKLILFEEMGKFPGLLHAWNVADPSLRQGSTVYGTMIAFGTGGCLVAGSKVWDKNGNLIDVEKVTKNTGIIGFKDGANIEPVTWVQPPTVKDCIKITTNTGRFLECSVDHPILSAIQRHGKGNIIGKEFIEATSLIVGRWIATIDKVDLWSNKDLPKARELGWLVGDGTYGNNQSTRIANCEQEILSYLHNNYNCKILREHVTKKGKIYQELRIKDFNKYLRQTGIYGQTSTDKRLPENIHSYSKQSVCEFIGGLFDTDGYVHIRNNPKRNTKLYELSISQANKDILLELQLLLQKLGIHMTIRKRMPRESNPKDVNPWYELACSDILSLTRFHQNITFTVQEKQSRMNQIAEDCKTRTPHKKNYLDGYQYEKVVSIEYTGVKPVYNLTANDSNTYVGNGIITHNTEGADFEGAKELFYKPKGYNIHGVENLWDKGRHSTLAGWFVPEYYNRENCYDENGNSDIKKSIDEILKERKLKIEETSDPMAIIREKAERPCCPSEAVISVSNITFPVAKLEERKTEIQTDPAKWIDTIDVGRVTIDQEGNYGWKFSDDIPIRIFPHKDNKNMGGAIEIYEHPQSLDKPLWGMYIMGVDTYDDDHSKTVSLGSLFVMNRLTSRIVAEYTGRPETAEEFYDIVLRVGKYYNSIINYENNKKGLFGYFDKKNSLHMLADNPSILRDMDIVSSTNNYGNKAKGTHATVEVNAYGRRLLKKYLLEQAYNKEDGIENYQLFRSIPAIEEMIQWNKDANFDRVSALGMLMILREDMHKINTKEQEDDTETVINDSFFSRHIDMGFDITYDPFGYKEGFNY